MTIREIIAAKDWVQLYQIMKDQSKDLGSNKLEYENDRNIREGQVGRREDKKTTSGPISVNRIAVPFQRKIVQTASSFLFGEPVRLILDSNSTNTDSFKVFINHWNNLRLDSALLKACEIAKSETESAILLRLVADGVVQEGEKQDIKIKASVLSSKNGSLYPVFDEFGDMVAFGYEFESTDANGDKVKNLYTYLKETLIRSIIDGDEIIEVDGSGLPHFFNRIPVVYFSQDVPEWEYVKDLIDRYETMLSKFADTNDYFASPFFKATGDVDFKLEKDNTGQVYKMDVLETDHGNLIQSDMDVISWEQSTESVKLEFETIKGLILELTDTPDLSFDNVKGLGNISGVALKLMFLSPTIKSKFTESIYRTGVERLINVLRAGMVYGKKDAQVNFFDDIIDVEFQSILPTNDTELINMLSVATMDKPVMSQKTALGLNPFIKNVEEEIEQLDQEAANELGDTANI